MAESFTMFAKFGDVCAILNEDDRKELIYAISMYGMFGVEPEVLAYNLRPLFLLMKEDIDHSKTMRGAGSKGGRPSKKPKVSEDDKPKVSETEKPQLSADPEKTESQYSTVQYSTDKEKEPNGSKEKSADPKKRKRFTPPSVEEVRAYCAEKGYHFDPEDFVNRNEAGGWLVGKARLPMKSWRAACATWESNWRKWHEGESSGGGPDGFDFDAYGPR